MSRYYRSRINRALQFISEHLESEITIRQLADAANFSPYHFQRIYKSLQSETPYETILRLRLEKGAFLLEHSRRESVTDVAFECGFSSIENFSRQFKKRFGSSPSAYKRNPSLKKSRIYQEPAPNDPYHCIVESRAMTSPEFAVEIERLPEIPTAFIRAFFGRDGSGLIDAYHELMGWAEKHSLPIRGPRRRFGMSVDDHHLTPSGLYRYDFALGLGEEFQIGGKEKGEENLIEFGEIPEGEYATLHCVGDLKRVAQAWDYLYDRWLPQSGYVPRHYPAVEEFLKGPEEIGWETFDINCRIPIQRTDDND